MLLEQARLAARSAQRVADRTAKLQEIENARLAQQQEELDEEVARIKRLTESMEAESDKTRRKLVAARARVDAAEAQKLAQPNREQLQRFWPTPAEEPRHAAALFQPVVHIPFPDSEVHAARARLVALVRNFPDLAIALNCAGDNAAQHTESFLGDMDQWIRQLSQGIFVLNFTSNAIILTKYF